MTFTIDTSQANRPISPLIYGLNFPERGDAGRHQGRRWCASGGNRWTAYNWETNASNAGSDYCFENDNYLTSSTTPGAAVLPAVAQAKAAGAAAIVTVPDRRLRRR